MGKRKTSTRARSAWEKRTIRELTEAGVLLGNPADHRFILYLAIVGGQSEEAKRLIDYGVDVNDSYENEATPKTLFQHAASKGNLDLIRYMVERGADPNLVGPEGTALHCAGRYGHRHVFDYLKTITDPTHHILAGRYLQDGEDRPREERDAIYRLSQACLMGQLPTINKLLAKGINPNASAIGLGGGTALHSACRGGHHKVVDILLCAGADPNAESYGGVTPIAVVATGDVCRALLKAGARANHRDKAGCTPLMRAISHDVFRNLVQAGAEMKAVDNYGRGALLHIATTAMERKITAWPKALKVDATFDKGLAASFRQLIKAGVSVNDRHPENGVTALMLLAGLDLHEAAGVLLQAGADKSARDKDGKTAQSYARTRSPLRKQLQAAEA